MSKEFGEKLNKSLIQRIAYNFYITNHAQERMTQRTNFVGEKLNDTVKRVRYEIINCSYAYNNNDGSVSIVMHDGKVMILSYSDEHKRWQFITIKDTSQNGYTPSEKRRLLQSKLYVSKKRNQNHTRMTEREEFNHSFSKHKNKPYKRDKRWKGESYES